MKENADVIALRFWNQFVEQMVKHIQTPARLNLLKRFAINIQLVSIFLISETKRTPSKDRLISKIWKVSDIKKMEMSSLSISMM